MFKSPLTILGILICFLGYGQSARSVSKISLQAIEMGSQTEISVECSQLVALFGLNNKEMDLTKDKKQILKMLANMTVNETQFQEVDARAKLYVHFKSGKVDEYCLGMFSHCYKNAQSMLLQNTEIQGYIDSVVRSKR